MPPVRRQTHAGEVPNRSPGRRSRKQMRFRVRRSGAVTPHPQPSCRTIGGRSGPRERVPGPHPIASMPDSDRPIEPWPDRHPNPGRMQRPNPPPPMGMPGRDRPPHHLPASSAIGGSHSIARSDFRVLVPSFSSLRLPCSIRCPTQKKGTTGDPVVRHARQSTPARGRRTAG